MKLTDLAKLPYISVFCLYNPKKNKVYLAHTNNMLLRFAKLIDELRQHHHSNKELCEDIDDLELVILETYHDIEHARLHMSYWKNYVTNVEGMELYNNNNYLTYRTRIYEDVYNERIYVELVNARNQSFVIGVFDHMIEAKEFKASLDKSEFIYPYYATNELTKKYLQDDIQGM